MCYEYAVLRLKYCYDWRLLEDNYSEVINMLSWAFFCHVKAYNYEIRAALIVRTITASQRHCSRCRVLRSMRLTFAEKQSHVQYDNRNLTLCSCECEHCTFSSSDSAKAASTQLVRMYRSVEWRASAAEGLSRATPAIRGFEGASESGATMISGPGLSPVSSWRRPESVWRRTLSYHSPPHNHTLAHSDPSLLSITEPLKTRNETEFWLNKYTVFACRHWRDSSSTDSSTECVDWMFVEPPSWFDRLCCRSGTRQRPRSDEGARTGSPEDHTRDTPISLAQRGAKPGKIKALNGASMPPATHDLLHIIKSMHN